MIVDLEADLGFGWTWSVGRFVAWGSALGCLRVSFPQLEMKAHHTNGQSCFGEWGELLSRFSRVTDNL